eukprot:1193916-Prorocentrum_minimum.AAC.4
MQCVCVAIPNSQAASQEPPPRAGVLPSPRELSAYCTIRTCVDCTLYISNYLSINPSESSFSF